MLYYFPPFIILNKTFSLQLLNSYELIPSSIRQESKIGKTNPNEGQLFNTFSLQVR